MTVPAPAPVRPHLVSFETGSFVRPVRRMVWEPVPHPLPPPSPVARRLLVIGSDADLARRVADRLGAEVCVPGHEPEGGDWDGIVDLNVTGVPYRLGGGEWRDALARTTRMVRHRYGAWREEPRADRCCYVAVTAMGGLMGYDDGPIDSPLGGIWAGFAKCLPRELPNLAVKVLDVDAAEAADADALAGLLAAELAAWDLFEIGYRRGVRRALTALPSPEPVPTLNLGPDDLVLISGGARGVGFALARGLAERFGCRVVVTGRDELPTADWLTLPDDRYAAHRRARIAAARTAGELREARAALKRESELRHVAANLAAAGRDGLRIAYEPCDCVRQEQVDALFARLPAPTVVVHNAGIDLPTRLDRKTPEEVVRTVEVKVSGFAALTRAVLATPERRAALKVFCNVGSLAGRMGGMIGQIDYAAGNEALSRLGFWARNTYGLPTQTLCWPTWERLGVIANYDAAVRYVSTIDPAEGVRRWIDELRSGGTGEVMFIGQVGGALVPTQLRGFWLFTGHPDLPRLHGLAHFLGTVEEFRPFRSLRGSIVHRPGAHPCLTDFTVDGRPALPVSVLVEQACSVADWVVPPGWPLQHLASVREVRVRPSALVLAEEGSRFTTSAVGETTEEGWTVHVSITAADGAVAGSMRLLYRPEPPSLPAPAPVPHPGAARDGGRLAWSGLVLGAADGPPPTVTAADLWTTPFPPAHGIAPAALEAAVRAAGPVTGDLVTIDRIVPCPGAQHVDELLPVTGGWTGMRAGEPVLFIARVTTGGTFSGGPRHAGGLRRGPRGDVADFRSQAARLGTPAT
ncbi:SDR family NAD(P)-dependent oxidoreductase [Nonomuraea angiospora]|uniref:SDR family NAD(P)-dependent oxidoreductase n=1 Tax=Nonomuraea angiospora TaxID=46172 RepID=UPI0029BA6515|nr:SDR family NAD(P)-dependent oxidoreductase [Nonomuraea angiospora]MDX3108924.1 SDR family NAD(P)-dependent oxidoreductase [Nonomuraea angiospora]